MYIPAAHLVHACFVLTSQLAGMVLRPHLQRLADCKAAPNADNLTGQLLLQTASSQPYCQNGGDNLRAACETFIMP